VLVMMMAWAGTLAGPFIAWRLWRRRSRLARAALVLLAIFYALGVWTFLIEPRLLVVRHVTVVTPAWTAPATRIAVLSDTHVGDPHVSAARVVRVVARINRERPDAVVFVGDYVGGHDPYGVRSSEANAEIERGIAALGQARAAYGRAAVLGNHDWWYHGPSVEAALRNGGVPVLENAAIRLQGRAGAFWIAGVADPYSERAPPSVPDALKAVPANEPVILLSHWPDVFPRVPDRVALTIAGHSHCGQVNFPLVGRPLTPSPGSAHWPCGLYDEGGRKLLVTGGLGTSILPVRFRAPPEIVIVTLRGPP
jgi:predicted MPP superfamily phosphohydrolase